jgi:2-methylcitrate dehydratase PrpD
LLDRDVNFSHVNEEKINDSTFKDVRSKVEIVVHPDWRPKYAMETPARVEIKLTNGKEFSTERQYAIGSPQEPISLAHFKVLFGKFTKGILPEAKIGWTADAIMNLETLDVSDVKELNRVLVFETTH